MTSSFIWALLGFGWVVATCLGVASAAMAYDIGHQYVFTAPGVSRTGPRVGRRLASLTFDAQGSHLSALSLRTILSSAHPTLLIFLGSLAEDADNPQVDKTLHDLERFAVRVKGNIDLVIFCDAAHDTIRRAVGEDADCPVIALSDDRLPRKLGVRVVPYAVLVDSQARVLAKGLANNAEHLCKLIMKGDLSSASADNLKPIIQLCDPSYRVLAHVTTKRR